MRLPEVVRIVEVGPRDGLQNEARPVPTEQRVRFIESLATAGLRTIEAGAFVPAKNVPAMADSAEVFRRLQRLPGVNYTALVPNLKGLAAALDVSVSEVAVFASASESFSQRNLHCSIAESLERYRLVCSEAQKAAMRVRGYVSCVAGCPYEGKVSLEAVLHVSEQLFEMGCYEVSLGDTIGVASPGQVESLLDFLLARIPASQVAVHFHDTWGQALANILVALQSGIGVIDSSAAGLGGCPFAPGATGNVATEDVLYMLQGLNLETGIDLVQVAAAGREMCKHLERMPSSKVSNALAARNQR